MLTIWSDAPRLKVLGALAPVLRTCPGLMVDVDAGFLTVPDTTVVLALGSPAMQFLAAKSLIPKGRTITSLRGQPVPYAGAAAMLSYSPDIGEINHAFHVDLLCDAAMAIRLHQTGSLKPVYGKYRWVDDFSDARQRIEAQFAATGLPVDCALDLETLGLDPYLLPTFNHPGAYIVTVQLSTAIGQGEAIYFKGRADEQQRLKGALNEQLAWLLTTPMVKFKGANLKFDLHWLKVRAGLVCSNFVFDSTLVGSLLDENRSNSLDVHVKIYAPDLGGYSDEFDRTVDKSRMDQVPLDKLLPYACGDTDGELRAGEQMKRELLDDLKLTAFYVNILHPASRAFEEVEQGGVLVDLPAFLDLRSDLQQEIAALVGQAKRMLGGRIVAKHMDSSREGGINLTKASLLCDFMFSQMGLNLKPKEMTEKSGKPSTALDHLLQFKSHPTAGPFVAMLDDYSSATKMLQTYVGEVGKSGFLKHLRSDGRFHPSYWFFAGDKSRDEGGTSTGRLSARDPAFQTAPKHGKWGKRIRKCFPAPPGYVVLESDFSQGELRIIACLANELNMISAYKAGKDLHCATAAPFAGFTYEELLALEKLDEARFSSTRQLGKAGNFGLIYGLGVDGFIVYAKQTYGVDLSRAEAQTFRDSFFSTYPGLLAYQHETKAFARQHGYVRSPLGRLRHLPLIRSASREVAAQAERQSVNSPTQGTLSDMLIWAIAINCKTGFSKLAPCFGAIHDATYNYVPEDQVDVLVPRHLEVMQNLPFEKIGWQPQLNFPADAKIGPNMGDLKKFVTK